MLHSLQPPQLRAMSCSSSRCRHFVSRPSLRREVSRFLMASSRPIASASTEQIETQTSTATTATTPTPTPTPPPPPPLLLPSPLRTVFSTGARTTSAAHAAWDALVRPGDFAVDATAGNGHDTLKLARLVGSSGSVLALDLNPLALASTRIKIEEEIFRRKVCGAEPLGRVDLVLGCHSRLEEAIRERERRSRRKQEESDDDERRLSVWSLGEGEQGERQGEEGDGEETESSSLPTVALAAFNLGYLPKFDDLRGNGNNAHDETETTPPPLLPLLLDEKAQLATATKPETTVLAIQAAAKLLSPGGTVSICSYFQHEGGGEEAQAVQKMLRDSFDPRVWTCVESRVLNRPEAPSLTLCYRSSRPKNGKKMNKGRGG